MSCVCADGMKMQHRDSAEHWIRRCSTILEMTTVPNPGLIESQGRSRRQSQSSRLHGRTLFLFCADAT